VKGESTLRFDRSVIIASDIAEQYFCEKKVELQYLYGEVETEEKSIGTEGHEKLLEGSVQVDREMLWKEIYGKKPIFALEMLLLARYNDVVLAGRPDSVLFQNGYPRIVFEYKFSKNRTAYRTHHVQARTYGILLRNMGFDTSRLFYAVVLADPRKRHDKELKRKVIDAVVKNGQKEAVIETENATIHFHKFNQTDAEQDLDWATPFWKKTREARASNPNKCSKCEHKTECVKSIHKELSYS
jgi:hypothetical protein